MVWKDDIKKSRWRNEKTVKERTIMSKKRRWQKKVGGERRQSDNVMCREEQLIQILNIILVLILNVY